MIKISLLISGGIDSTISAWIFKNLNYKLTGIFIINWENEICKSNFKNIIIITNFFNIKFKIINFIKIYKIKIFKKLIKNFRKNKSYLPDIFCNKIIKFNYLIKYSKINKIKYISSGHYSKLNKNLILKNSLDVKKNQNYFLNILNKKKLKNLIFPLGNIKKTKIREISKKIKIFNFKKKDSMGICFIENNNFLKFLKNYLNLNFGFIIENNKKIGIHYGTYFNNLGKKLNIKNNLYINSFKKNNLISNNFKNFFFKKIFLSKIINNFKKIYKNNFYLLKYKNCVIYKLCFIKFLKKKNIIIKIIKLKELINKNQILSIFDFKKNCLFSIYIKKSI